MKFSILSQQNVIGVLPYSALLSGSADLGDVLNSWITYVNKALISLPTHPLAILNKSIPTIVHTAATLADSFRLEAAPVTAPMDTDGVVTFKGVDYYVVDYDTEDAARTEITLSCIKKSVIDTSRAEEDLNGIELDTLDLLFAFVTGQLSNALNNAAFAKQTATGPVAVASPALPKTPSMGQYKTLPYPAPVTKPSAPVADVAAAKAALSALLQKGHL